MTPEEEFFRKSQGMPSTPPPSFTSSSKQNDDLAEIRADVSSIKFILYFYFIMTLVGMLVIVFGLGRR